MNIPQTTLVADSWGMHGDIGTGWWVVMMVAMVLFWGAVLFGIAFLIRGAAGGWSTPHERRFAPDSSMDILERRFAEGAISVEDYRTRREVLLHGPPEANGAREDQTQTAPPAQEPRQ